METAPYFAELAEGPSGGTGVWLRADDGVRIRAVFWPDGAQGTVFLFPGRCEYVEKYGRTAANLAVRGFATLAVDWRGQGLSDRLLTNPDIGHVQRFTDYQFDVQACLALADAQGLPKPWFLLAHSMGGAIGLRALTNRAPFAAAGFSAPMWGIVIAPSLKHVAATVPRIARSMGLGGRQTPTTSPASYFLHAPFEGNFLTTDETYWAYMTRQAAFHPRFRLGGPSLTWLAEALSETYALQTLSPPSVRTIIGVGTEEKIVDVTAMKRVAARWATAELVVYQGAEHELLMERPDVRTAFLDRMETLFLEV
ncbi:MAG: alpha/beta hydrolase [Pseudomonadota bacterium]